MHHHVYFIPDAPLTPTIDQFSVASKYFLPHRNIDWFKHPILMLDTFEEGNIASISPTFKVGTSIKLGAIQHIIHGASYFPKEVNA